jgi:hypothetical protein
MPTNREIASLVKEARRQGFEPVFGKRTSHFKIKKDGKTICALPSTPGGGSTVVKQILKRAYKQLNEHGFEGEFRW